jgi:hypothetical protein
LKRGGSLNEQSLVDVEIKASIDQYTSKVGKVSNIVKAYLPAHPAGHASGHSSPIDVPVADMDIPF